MGTNFYPPFGVASAIHPVTGMTLALLGEGSGPNMVPPVVRVPAMALAASQPWPATSDALILATDDADTALLPPDITRSIVTSRIIPLPPCLIQFFTDRAQIPLLPLTKMFLRVVMAPDADPGLQLLCHATAQFLRAAVTMTTAHAHAINHSQLAIDFEQVPWDEVITHWASTRYTVYNLLHPPTVAANAAQQAPGGPNPAATRATQCPQASQNVINQQQQQHPAPPAPQIQPNQPPPPLPPAPQDVHQAPNMPIHGAPAPVAPYVPQPLDEDRLMQIVAATVASTMHRAGQHTAPLPDLDQNIPVRHARIMGIDLTNLITWCGLQHGNPLPPFWDPFINAPSDTTRTYILQSLLTDAQNSNVHVQFSLRPDTIRDLKGLKYHLYDDTECPTRGVTPFSLFKIASTTLRELYRDEEAADQASHLTIQDIM